MVARMDKPHLPPCEAIIQSWDTAFLKTQRQTTVHAPWGIFHHPNADGQTVPNLILIDAYKEKLEFPELKKQPMINTMSLNLIK